MSQNQTLLAIQVWIATAWADGKITPAEEQGMKAVIAMAKLTEAEREIARGWLTTPIKLEDVDVSKIAGDERANVFAAALSVVAMDDEIAAAELGFIDRLQKVLHIDAATAVALKKRAGV
jgi:uncharacterized membrane protein YebE (DUF533 family)